MSQAHALPTWPQELAATLRLAGPLAAANILQMAIHAIGVIFVARLGPDILAAASLGVAVYGLVQWALAGLTGSVSALIAEELGRRRHAVREVRRSTRMGIWLAVLSGAAGMGICMGGEWAMHVTGQDPEVARRAGDYLAILMFALVPMTVANVLRNFVSALGKPAFATMITALMIGVDALGTYMLVFGKFGAPELGLTGAGIATVITSIVFVLSYVVVIAWHRQLRRYRIWGRWWRPEWDRLRALWRVGAPVAVTIIAEAGIFNAAAFMMGALSPLALAAHTLALQIAAIAFQVPFGIGQAATIRVGYFYGARNAPAIARAGIASIAIGAGFMILTASTMLLFPHALLGIYVDTSDHANQAMIGLALGYMVIAAAFQLADGMQAVALGLLRGLQDTRVPMAYALFGYWGAGLATAWVLAFHTSLQGFGVWIGLAVGLLVVAVLMLRRWALRERLGLIRPQPGNFVP